LRWLLAIGPCATGLCAFGVACSTAGGGVAPDAAPDDAEIFEDAGDGEVACGDVLCGEVCCPEELCSDEGLCLLPDLVLLGDRALSSAHLTEEAFAEDNCAVVEGCVNGPGTRRLLRFDAVVLNQGNADVVLGHPSSQPELFIYSECHGHHHFEEFADYRLLDEGGNVVAVGHKQAFCFIDNEATLPGAGPAQYTCEFQGLTQGWTDVYAGGLDCQWVDVTGLPGGTYTLEVTINTGMHIAETDYTNNVATVRIELPADPNTCDPSTETCWDGIDQSCSGTADDGCDPVTGNVDVAHAFAITRSGTYRSELSASAPVPASDCGGAGAAAVFSLSLPDTEVVYLATYGSAMDTVLSVVEDKAVDAEVVCSDDGCGTGQSDFAGELPAGNYFVVVRAKDALDTGEISLQLDRSYGCRGAGEITAPGKYTSTTADDLNRRVPQLCPAGDGRDEFWRFTTCPGQHEVVLSTCGSSFDTVVELRRGGCAGWNAVECEDNARGGCVGDNGKAVLTDTLDGPGLWFVVIDGVTALDQGEYELDFSMSP
jgi:hypothetical protein